MEALSTALDERRAELDRLKDEQQNIMAEWADRRYDDVTRSRLNELETEIREAEAFVSEKEKSLGLVQRHAENPQALERVHFQSARPGAVKGDDIWDMSTVERSEDPEHEERQYLERAHRAIEKAQFPGTKREEAQEHAEYLISDAQGRKGSDVARYMLATGSPEYKRSFTRYLANPNSLTDKDRGLLERAMSLTAASGGYAVPFELDTTILPTSAGAVNPYRAISNVSSISVDEWRGITSDGITAAFGAEAAVATDSSPTLVQPTVSTEKAFAFIPYSIEIGQDWNGFAAEMSGMLRDSKDVLEATKFAVGSGTNEPFGVITGSSASVYTASNTNSLVLSDVYGVHGAIGPRFRQGVWVMNNAVLDKIRQLDTAGGSAMLTSSLQARSSGPGAFTDGRANVDIFGHPVYEASGQSGTFTTGQLIAVFGDFNYYKIVDRIGMTIENIPHLFGAAQGNLPTGQRGLYAYWRVGAKVLSANAFKVLKLA